MVHHIVHEVLALLDEQASLRLGQALRHIMIHIFIYIRQILVLSLVLAILLLGILSGVLLALNAMGHLVGVVGAGGHPATIACRRRRLAPSISAPYGELHMFTALRTFSIYI